MPYAAFEICTIKVGDQLKRGARAVCSQCHKREEVQVNGRKSTAGGYDDDVAERDVASKFEKCGWKTGKRQLCPKCYSEEKVLTTFKKETSTDKVVLMSTAATPPPRQPTRDEKRIIFQKIDEMYVGEQVGYHKDWCDERVAKDLNVPVGWVAAIREENFGPNIDEASVAVVSEAKALLEEAKQAIQSWQIRADEIEKRMRAIENRK